MSENKPCPICGGEAETHRDGTVNCGDHGCNMWAHELGPKTWQSLPRQSDAIREVVREIRAYIKAAVAPFVEVNIDDLRDWRQILESCAPQPSEDAESLAREIEEKAAEWEEVAQTAANEEGPSPDFHDIWGLASAAKIEHRDFAGRVRRLAPKAETPAEVWVQARSHKSLILRAMEPTADLWQSAHERALEWKLHSVHGLHGAPARECGECVSVGCESGKAETPAEGKMHPSEIVSLCKLAGACPEESLTDVIKRLVRERDEAIKTRDNWECECDATRAAHNAAVECAEKAEGERDAAREKQAEHESAYKYWHGLYREEEKNVADMETSRDTAIERAERAEAERDTLQDALQSTRECSDEVDAENRRLDEQNEALRARVDEVERHIMALYIANQEAVTKLREVAHHAGPLPISAEWLAGVADELEAAQPDPVTAALDRAAKHCEDVHVEEGWAIEAVIDAVRALAERVRR